MQAIIKSASNLNSNIGNFASSLSIPASVPDCSEISDSFSLLFWFSTYNLTTYFTEKTEIWERITFTLLLQSLQTYLWL